MPDRLGRSSASGVQRTTVSHEKNVREIIFWDEGNPNCVVNRLTPELKERVLQIPPYLLNQTEKELISYLHESGSSVLEPLRLAFWDEFAIASDTNKRMRVAGIYGDICSREYFNREISKDHRAMAFILHPPRDYMYKMRSLLELAHRRLEEILNLPIKDGRGKVDTALLDKFIKIAVLVENRVRGAVTQKLQIDQTSKNFNLNTTVEAPKSVRQIEAEIKKIEREIEALEAPPKDQPDENFLLTGNHKDVIDVEPEEPDSSSTEEERA